MNEEELFCKLFPEYAVNGKPLSPYIDLFESGYEQAEKRIEELGVEVKEWKDKADLWCKTANLRDHNIMINKELEKENTELKKQLEMSNKVYNDNLDYSHHIEEQLTNAKEIIREFMKYEINEYDGSLEIHFEELKKQAEQFISEVEK